jgi:hypothetical protein
MDAVVGIKTSNRLRCPVSILNHASKLVATATAFAAIQNQKRDCPVLPTDPNTTVATQFLARK